MINAPIPLTRDGFQETWLEAVRLLMRSAWEVRNLIVHVRQPTAFDLPLHDRVTAFAKSAGVLTPKHVAYTIFPHGLYQRRANSSELFTAYNKPDGFYSKVKTGWGTYFRRMTSYKGANGPVNQLGNIIAAIRDRQNLSKAAYTIVIQHPGGETVRPLGGPCLNYIAVQAEPGQDGQPPTVGLLAVYRNHDFLERAYGNYWGLCNLLMFLAKEVDGIPGPLTCVSSHAYVDKKKTALKALMEGM